MWDRSMFQLISSFCGEFLTRIQSAVSVAIKDSKCGFGCDFGFGRDTAKSL